jgi:hypothetical protein
MASPVDAVNIDRNYAIGVLILSHRVFTQDAEGRLTTSNRDVMWLKASLKDSGVKERCQPASRAPYQREADCIADMIARIL